MSKNRKITTEEFNYLENLEPYLVKRQRKAFKEFKYTLLRTVEGVFGDKWYNLKDKTRSAVDFICFLSVERGYFYASPYTIAEESGISKSTVYEALKQLRANGVLVKANRTSRKQNGLGTAIHFFTVHPYFDHIREFLNLDWKPNQKADWKAENAEIPCESKVEEPKNLPTYSLPSSLDLKDNMNNHLNDDHETSEEAKSESKQKYFKYVPKSINLRFASIFKNNLVELWKRVSTAYRTAKSAVLDKNDMLQVGVSVLQFLMKKLKEKSMSLDEQCAYVFSGAREAFMNINDSKLDQGLFEDIEGEVRPDFNNLPDYLREDYVPQRVLNVSNAEYARETLDELGVY